MRIDQFCEQSTDILTVLTPGLDPAHARIYICVSHTTQQMKRVVATLGYHFILQLQYLDLSCHNRDGIKLILGAPNL